MMKAEIYTHGQNQRNDNMNHHEPNEIQIQIWFQN